MTMPESEIEADVADDLSEAPTLAVVVVSWFTGERLEACLRSVGAADEVDELILVNNGNPPEVEDALFQAQERGELTLVSGHGNVGFASGCNRGARAARSDYVLFLNPDAELTPGAAGRLTEVAHGLERWPALVGGRVLGLDGVEQRGGRRGALTLWAGVVEVLGLSRLSGLHPVFRSMHWEGEPLPTEPIDVGAVSGAMMLMNRQDYEALGGFDEGYFAHVEDIDLCRRILNVGGLVKFVPDAEVIHEGATSPASPLRVARLKARGMTRYFTKFAQGPVHRYACLSLAGLIYAAALTRAALRR